MIVAERIAIGPKGDTFEINLGVNRYHYRTDGRAHLMKEGINHAYPCRVTSETIKYALSAIVELQLALNEAQKHV